MYLSNGSRKKLRDYYGIPEQALPHSQVAHFNPFAADVSNRTTAEFGTREDCEIELPTYQQAVQLNSRGEDASNDFNHVGYLCFTFVVIVIVCGVLMMVALRGKSGQATENHRGQPFPG